MSHKATNWAVSQRGINPVAKVLLWQLADRHNPDNGCFPDQATLARDCEISRASVNRNLLDLEKVGLIKRIQRIHPVTKKQLPTRYVLAFEDEFGAETSDGPAVADDAEDGEGRVSDCDTAPAAGAESQPATRESPGRVSNPEGAESHPERVPSLTDETPNKGLTGKLTSNSTGRRAVRAERESDFKKIWKVFPERPGSSELGAWEAFERLDDTDAAKCIAGAERYAAHFREQGALSKDAPEERLRYVPYLANWIAKQEWLAALKLPVKALPGTEAAKVMEGVEYVHKASQPVLFAACERVRGRPVPVGSSGAWAFPNDLVAAARKQIAERSGTGPP